MVNWFYFWYLCTTDEKKQIAGTVLKQGTKCSCVNMMACGHTGVEIQYT